MYWLVGCYRGGRTEIGWKEGRDEKEKGMKGRQQEHLMCKALGHPVLFNCEKERRIQPRGGSVAVLSSWAPVSSWWNFGSCAPSPGSAHWSLWGFIIKVPSSIHSPSTLTVHPGFLLLWSLQVSLPPERQFFSPPHPEFLFPKRQRLSSRSSPLLPRMETPSASMV